MKEKYVISELRKALDVFKKSNPQTHMISIQEIDKVIRKLRTPVIYNIDELIKLLNEFIDYYHPDGSMIYQGESSICDILKVKKLTMHLWRKKKLIRYDVTNGRTIIYNIFFLLEDLKNIRGKYISFGK